MLPTLEHPPSATPPRQRRRTPPGLRVVACTWLAIALTALLNCNDLVRVAQRRPFGWQRTVALRIAEADRAVSRALWLDRPRRPLDSALGHDTRTPASPEVPVVPQPTPVPGGVVPPPREQPTRAQPLRIYFAGDSVAAAISTAFARSATATHVMRTTVDYRISTGLSRPDYFNWPQRLQRVTSRKPVPQVVVVMFGANDMQGIMTPNGAADPGTAKWTAEYRRRVAAVMDVLSAAGVDVYWLGQPLMRDHAFTRLLNGVDAIYADEASRHPAVRFIDTRPLLADSKGHYAAYLPDRHGHKVLVRAPDGVHLTEAGGARVATAVLQAIADAWHVPVGG